MSDKKQLVAKPSKIDNYLNADKGFKKFLQWFSLSKEDKDKIKQLKKQLSKDKNSKKTNFNKQHIFEICNLNLFYGNNKQALHNINLNIKKGEVTAFIGPSGCGKSTLLWCLNRLNNAVPNVRITGNIYFDDGTNINSKKLSHIELTTRVGMIFQRYLPFPMTIYENVAYGPRCHGITNQKILDNIVRDALVDAALWDEVKNNLHDKGTSLSGGQQQRLCIARAIALHPEVLLMDEPTSGLDPIATSKIENLILKLKKKYTIILVTHSMAQAQRVSDNTVFLSNGKVVEQGPTKIIFTAPTQHETKDYILGRN